MRAVQPLAAKQAANLAGLCAAIGLLKGPQPILRAELAPLRLGHDLRVRRRSGSAVPGGLVATLLDPQGRIGNLIQCHRVSLCGHRFSPPPPYSNSKGSRCLSHVGREGRANPSDFMLMNNLAFALINRGGRGDIEEAGQVLSKAGYLQLSNQNRLVLQATQGFLAFRSGDVVSGRKLYSDARLEARNMRDDRLLALASVFHAMEEISQKTSSKVRSL